MSSQHTSRQRQAARASYEAAQWLQVMRGDSTGDDRRAFVQWLESSPLHVRELLVAVALERELLNSNDLERFDVDALIERVQANANVVAMKNATTSIATGSRRRPRRMVRWVRAAVISGVVLIAGMSAWSLRPMHQDATRYATGVGVSRVVNLADGTVVTLAPRTRVAIDFSTHARNVTLYAGKATFKVAHNAAWPFQVYAGTSLIRDVGTQFSVNRLPSGVVVAVTEGEIKVMQSHRAALDDGIGAWLESWLPNDADAISQPGLKLVPLAKPHSLVAGEVAHVARNGGELAIGKLASSQVSSAMPHRLLFHHSTLADIVAEFNRYNSMQLKVDGSAARHQRYSGVFDANDPESFLKFLACCSRLELSRTKGYIVITLPSQSSRHAH